MVLLYHYVECFFNKIFSSDNKLNVDKQFIKTTYNKYKINKIWK